MKCGIHVYVCHDALSMQCLYALLDLSWCGTAQNTERRTLVSHTVYTCKLLSFNLFLRPSVLLNDIFLPTLGKLQAVDRFSVIVPSAVKKKEEVERQQLTSVNSVTYQCAPFRVLSCTTPRKIQQGI